MKVLRYIVNPSTKSTKDYNAPIKEILSSSSLAYLLSPIRSKRLLIKIIWIVFLFAFLFGSIYYVVLEILNYLQYEITTSIFTINEQEAEFPTISFCNTKNSNILGLGFQSENLIDEWQYHIESYTDKTYGNCYRFNSGFNLSNQSMPIKKVRKSGLENALYMDIYSNTSRYFEGLMIYIHNHTAIPDTIYDKGFFIHPGSLNQFIIKRVYDQKLELPYNNCYKNVSKSNCNQTIINYLKEKKREYSQNECLYLCRNLKYKEINPCNFSLDDLEIDIYFKAYILNNKTIIRCIDSFFRESNNYELCSTLYCPLECESLTYDLSLNSQSVIGHGNVSLYNIINTFEDTYKTFYPLRFYYGDLKYTLIKQQPKIELFGLISNIGGLLGLFLGFSFISLLELFEVVAELVCIKFL